MECPFIIKKIRDVIVACGASGKAVSYLRYPCMGNYEKCPYYIKEAHKRGLKVAEIRPTKEVKKEVMRPRKEPPPEIIEELKRYVVVERKHTKIEETKPHEISKPREEPALKYVDIACDEVAITHIIVSGTIKATKRNIYVNSFMEEVLTNSLNNVLAMATLRFKDSTFRVVASSGKTISVGGEVGDIKLCGEEAMNKLLEKSRSPAERAILYIIDVERLPKGVKEKIKPLIS